MYEEDNFKLYEKCVNQDEYYDIPDYSDDLKVYYHVNEMNVGFLKDEDNYRYNPRGDSFITDDNNNSFITNKDGDDIVNFGRIYAEISGDYVYNFL